MTPATDDQAQDEFSQRLQEGFIANSGACRGLAEHLGTGARANFTQRRPWKASTSTRRIARRWTRGGMWLRPDQWLTTQTDS
jgi:hypothetical protein